LPLRFRRGSSSTLMVKTCSSVCPVSSLARTRTL
jgi:hypothetical protein